MTSPSSFRDRSDKTALYNSVATGCHGNLPVLNFLSASVAKSQHFRPYRKKLCVGSKNDWHLLELSRRSLSARKVWGDRSTGTGCRSENWCFFVCNVWSACAWGHSSNKDCDFPQKRYNEWLPYMVHMLTWGTFPRINFGSMGWTIRNYLRAQLLLSALFVCIH